MLWQLGVEEKGGLKRHVSNRYVTPVWFNFFCTIKRFVRFALLGRAQPVIPPNLYSLFYVNEHNSLGSSGKVCKVDNGEDVLIVEYVIDLNG